MAVCEWRLVKQYCGVTSRILGLWWDSVTIQSDICLTEETKDLLSSFGRFFFNIFLFF